MLWKNGNKKVGLCVMVVIGCLVLATVWAVLVTPDTALAEKPDNPGGNVVKQDIPGKLTLTGDNLKSDDPPLPYSNSDAGTTCFIGRRRSIWVTLSKNSPRKMNLTLTGLDYTDFTIQQGADTITISQGDDPWGNEVPGVLIPNELPNGDISQVELQIAPYLNVSGLGTGDELAASTWLLFLDGEADQWGLYFGRGRPLGVEDGWGGARFFTELTAEPVIVSCLTENKSWTVTSITPGYLWYRGSKKNAPWVYVGKCNVPWSCNVESLP